jgi:hypothetical protein
MSSEVPEGAAPTPGRRSSRTDGGAPVSGAIVAVVAGFLILRSIDDDGGTPSAGDDTGVDEETDDSTTTLASDTTLPAVTTTTEPPLVTEGATVVVANVNGVNGSAGGMTRELEAVGYTMGTPTNGAEAEGQYETTVIYFDPAVVAAEAVAGSVGRSLGGVDTISPVATPAPTADGELNGAGVLVMLGNDKAGSTIAELSGGTETDGTSPGVTSPDPAATTTTTTG